MDSATPSSPPWTCSRRAWLTRVTSATLPALAFAPAQATAHPRSPVRSFDVCLVPPLVVGDPELVETVRQAGIRTVWLAGYFYGHRPYPEELLRQARATLARAGLDSQLITVPLGHPGDSLGSSDGDFPLTPPRHWQMAERPDGRRFAGTSLHSPATEENARALAELRRHGFDAAFVDDDFRLARGPGEIGGCFCPGHRERFLRRAGLSHERWPELLADTAARRLSPLLRSWIDFTCDELSDSFRAQARAFRGEFGVMAMYLGAEKAGIRLRDYRDALFRVGELMFDDRSFGSVKGKTDELFSVLFHRRFAAAERAYSETTAFPADQLSANHLAAKLTISTVADVRHSLFMSGLTPFPRAHWATLAPAMKHQAALHDRLAGHRLRGPFKHFWGEAQRLVGDDRPFSLWLALGVPFEVIDRPTTTANTWTFLSDFDARELRESRLSPRAHRISRPTAAASPGQIERVEESLPALFAFRRRWLDQLGATPHVLEEAPALCAWYPTARSVLVWNLSPEPRRLTLRIGQYHQELHLGPLASEVVGYPSGAV